MTELPTSFDRCQLWRTTLQEQAADQFASERGRLRTSLLSFRDRAAHLANEIRRDLPEATVHDLTHLDALWEVAATIAGDGYAVTPAEGFVLGGAILLHDLAMSVAAIEGGLEAIKRDPRWADLVFSEVSRGPRPRPDERGGPQSGNADTPAGSVQSSATSSC
jgi:hypothetical protein